MKMVQSGFCFQSPDMRQEHRQKTMPVQTCTLVGIIILIATMTFAETTNHSVPRTN